jgi:hypothetical protein
MAPLKPVPSGRLHARIGKLEIGRYLASIHVDVLLSLEYL